MTLHLQNLIADRVGPAKATSGAELATILSGLLTTAGPSQPFVDVATLLSTTQEFSVGIHLTAVAENIVYRVVAKDSAVPQIALASGTRVVPCCGVWGLDARATGVVADGVTDDTAAVQLAIDLSLFGEEPPTKVNLPAGTIRVTDTIHLGYGDTGFATVPLVGHGKSYAGNHTNHAGTVLFADHTNGPAINIQANRNGLIQDIFVRGVNREHASTLPFNAAALDKATWLGPRLPANADSRFAPYAGVSVDAYSGSRPAISYSDVDYPPWGGNAQYDRNTSSSIRLLNVAVEGFVVGVACQPCDFDVNGDFLTLRDCRLANNVYGLSIGNSQSRSVQIADCEFDRVWTALTTDTHGRQIGNLHGTISNASLTNTISIFKLGSLAFAGPLTVMNMYAETTYRLGQAGSNTSNENNLTFINPRLKLGGLHTDAIGVPATIFDVPMQDTSVRFEGGYLESGNLLVFNSDQVVFDETHTDAISRRTDGVSTGLADAHNLAGNAVFGPIGTSARGSSIRAQTFDELGNRSFATIRPHMDSALQSDIGLADASVSGLTLTHPSIVAGDIVIEPVTMSVFLAQLDGEAVAQNNYRLGSLIAPLPTSGVLWRRYL